MNKRTNRSNFKIVNLNLYQDLKNLTSSPVDYNIILVYGDGTCTYIDGEGNKTNYDSIQQAIDILWRFSGVVRLEEDLYQEFETSDFSTLVNSSLFNFYSQNLIFDLNNHSSTIKKNDDGNPATCRFMLEIGNSKIKIRNGTLICDGIQMLWIYGGEFRLENVNAYSNLRLDVRPCAMSRGFFYVDNKSTLTFTYDKCSMYDNGQVDNMAPGIWAFGDEISSYSNWEDYKTTQGESGIYRFIEDFDQYMPTVEVDGTMISKVGPSEDQTRTCDLIFTSGNPNKMPVKYVVGNNAMLHAFNGTSLFLNSCGKIIINGGRIYGKTPIVLRSGILSVPKGSNPIVYGNGNGNYSPTLPGGQGTSMLNKLGNAVVFESVGSTYGKYSALDGNRFSHGELPKAEIEGGEYYSLFKNPIGSYGHATGKSYFPRPTGFMHGGILGKEPSQEEYNPVNGENSDYGIIGNNSSVVDICQIMKHKED